MFYSIRKETHSTHLLELRDTFVLVLTLNVNITFLGTFGQIQKRHLHSIGFLVTWSNICISLLTLLKQNIFSLKMRHYAWNLVDHVACWANSVQCLYFSFFNGSCFLCLENCIYCVVIQCYIRSCIFLTTNHFCFSHLEKQGSSSL